MIKTTTQLAKDLHRRMGFPLGKAHYRLQLFRDMWKGYGSPLRHVRRLSFNAQNLGEVMERKKQAQHFLENIDPAVSERARELRTQGFTRFTEQTDAQLLGELMKYYDEVISKRSETAQASPTHPYFFPLTDPNEFTTDNIIIRFALQDSILQAVSARFGSAPILSSISILESRSVPIESKRLKAAQQWHLDYTQWGEEFVSAWVYFTDVPTVDQGPLTYIPVPESRRVKNGIFPSRVQDEEIQEAGLNDEIRQITGPRGSVFFIDTNRCYHMGSRLKEGEKRAICIFSFSKAGHHKGIVKITTPVSDYQKLVICR